MNEPKWPPLDVEYPPESTVKVLPGGTVPTVTNYVEEPVEPVEPEPTPNDRAKEIRVGILAWANDHIDNAVYELDAAIGWFEIVAGDSEANTDLLRQVEGLAETIAYRLKNATER